MKTQAEFLRTHLGEAIVALSKSADKKTLARWACACAERVMPCFEKVYPEDPRPRQALATLQAWIQTGEFKMAVIRTASLAAHAAARAAGPDSAARAAARAAGQAVATAHVAAHSMGAALYALQAVQRAAGPAQAAAAMARERKWQLAQLRRLT